MKATNTSSKKTISLNFNKNKSRGNVRRQVLIIANYLMKKYGYSDWKCLNDWDSYRTIITLIKL